MREELTICYKLTDTFLIISPVSNKQHSVAISPVTHVTICDGVTKLVTMSHHITVTLSLSQQPNERRQILIVFILSQMTSSVYEMSLSAWVLFCFVLGSSVMTLVSQQFCFTH